jgi:glycosyltransferase involved in cell wall biosynthesis
MDIVIHAFPAWEGNYLKSTVQLATELAQQHRVLYIDYAYTLKDCWNSWRGRGFARWRRLLGVDERLQRVDLPNGAWLRVLSVPPILPANFLKNPMAYDAVMGANAALIRPHIQRAISQLGFENFTVVNAFNPALGVHLAGKLGEKRLVYYCYDEISAANWAKEHGARLERAFIKKVDAVIVSSEGLYKRKAALHPETHVVKNGVDFDLFNQKTPPSVTDPIFSEIVKTKAVQTPTIGYLGSVDERLDYDLLEKLAQETPQYRYVFVGRVLSESVKNRLSALQNVRLAGAQPPTSLPAWVQQFDVCLIPFVKNDFTAGIYPLKANEYLAAGKAVVATNFGDLQDFKSVVSIADGVQDFKNAVVQSLEANPEAVEKRVAYAAQNAWSARAAAMSALLKN